MKTFKIAGVLMLVSLPGCPPAMETTDASRGVDAFAAMDAAADGGVDAPLVPDSFVPPDATFDGGPPDAAGPPCTTPGSTRRQPCVCGVGFTRVETCIAGSWRITESCDYQATMCEPGTVRPYNLRCSVGIQRCTPPDDGAGCAWGPPELTTPEGECEAGIVCGSGSCRCRADCTCPLMNDRGECLP